MRMLTEQLQDRRRWLREIIMFSVNTAILEILRPEHTNINFPNLDRRLENAVWACSIIPEVTKIQIKLSQPVLIGTTYAISINILSKKEQN